MDDDISAMPVEEYIAFLKKEASLSINDAEMKESAQLLRENWFTCAGELAVLDGDAVSLLRLPPQLASAILMYFHDSERMESIILGTPYYAPPNYGEHSLDPVRANGVAVEAGDVVRRGSRGGDFDAALSKVIAQSGGDEYVMQGLGNILKKSIDESDSGNGKSSTMKKSVLRKYLKQVNQQKSRRSLSQSGLPTELKGSDANCSICGGRKDEPVALDCAHSYDKSCLHDWIMDKVGAKKAVGMVCPVTGCTVEISVKHIQACLDGDEFNQYLEATLMAFIEQDNLTFQCPNDSCFEVFSVEPMQPQEVPNPITEKDAEGNVLSAEAWLHFMEFRVRCRACTTVFCAECKRVPYHKGYTCQGFVEYEKSRQCRFCNTKLTAANTASNSPGAGLNDVCTDEECLAKREVCCVLIKECGCPCNGVRDEDPADCLPCLKHELEVADDFCSICYVEALKDAPCVQVPDPCNHVFHYQCVVNRLAAGWPGARISFDFLTCPLCHKRMDEHASLAKPLKPFLEVKERVDKMALERLEYEGRKNDPAVVHPGGRFYQDPVGFANHLYLFYKCHKCKNPYFAGGYQCQEANAPFNEEELVCPSCQPGGSQDDCPKHGKDWLAFKCRYCCNFANWYCWGRTHFCGNCHKSGVWQKLCEFRTGKNRKKLWEYDGNCPGLKSKIDVIAADKSLSEPEKEKRIEGLLADPASCPLGVAHPPAGFEFGLGCSMCEDKKDEKKNAEVARKAREEAERMQAAFEHVKELLANSPHGYVPLEYGADFDDNGLFFFLGSCGRSIRWSNPADSGFVAVRSSGMMADSAPLASICGHEVVRTVTKPTRNSWIQVDLKDLSLEPSHYSIRHYSSWDTECLRNWVLEGSNDGLTWHTLCHHHNDKSLNKKGGTHTWIVNTHGQRYRIFRIIQTGVNSNNHYYLAMSGLELYGKLYDSVPEVIPDVEEDEDRLPTKTFSYAYDFDDNGIFYHLGCNLGASQWRNPALIDQVNVTSSELAAKPPSKPAYAIVGRELVRCVTMARPNMWFMVDLKNKKARVEAYTLKHYNSWDTEALRNWRFEGSNDGQRWVTLRSHNDDRALNAKGATHTWTVHDCNEFYSMFRILQTGKNSNNHYYLSCSGMEIYGELRINPPLNVPMAGLQLDYSYDFDCNGLFYWLGTRGRRHAWRNPANMGLVSCSASEMAANPPSAPTSALCGRSLVRCVSAPQPNMWMMIDLKDKAIEVTHYTLRHYNSWDTEALRNWVFEGSNDGIRWIVLREHMNDWALDKKGATFTWPVSSMNNRFRMLRIKQTGVNSNNHHYLACSGLELYGKVFNSSGADVPRDVSQGFVPVSGSYGAPAPRPDLVKAGGGKGLEFDDGKRFVYMHDMDENGLLYWLGTNGLTREYRNPGMLGIVKVTNSPLASQSMPSWAACGRTVVRCVTEPKKGTWFCFDFGDIFVIPTHYTLRHYDSWDTEALRDWKLEASIDGKKWKTLLHHKKDKALDRKGATHTWPINGVTKSYSMFRILQTGKNSNKHWYLALSGFEIYGSIWSFRKK